MRTIFMGVVALTLLAGCGDDVPAVQDADRIVLRGKLVSQQEFLQTYCQNKSTNATCAKVKASMVASNGSKNPVARN